MRQMLKRRNGFLFFQTGVLDRGILFLKLLGAYPIPHKRIWLPPTLPVEILEFQFLTLDESYSSKEKGGAVKILL